jgi:phage terminase small subunit
MTVGILDRNEKAASHLQLLRSLANELERAMQAIAHNALSDLEESVANQQVLSAQLGEWAEDLDAPVEASPASSQTRVDEDLMQQIYAANDRLQNLNHRYSMLLKLSSHSVALMASLFSSFKGQFQEAPGAGLKHHTWSCQM